MKPDIYKASSRPMGVAQTLTVHALDEASVYSKKVLLIGEPKILASKNGHWCFLDALRLLSRVVGHLTVVVPPGLIGLENEVNNFCANAWSRGSIAVKNDCTQVLLDASDAILNVGSQVMPALPWTVVNCNGWVARISSGQMPLPGDVEEPNPIAALMAASLGVTDIFKRIFDIPCEAAPLLEKTEFSLYDQKLSPTWIGPPLPYEISIPDTLLVGAGAIGNGIALLFSQLPVKGRLHVVDKQNYADENLGTCVLLEEEGWIGESKAERIATWLNGNSRLEVTGEKNLIEVARSAPTISGLSVDLVLTALDDIEARCDAQGLWPSIIIDGGINEVGAAVIQHHLDQEELACLKCWFDPPKKDERFLQSSLTGLRLESLKDAGRILTEDDVMHAAEGKRDWLKKCLLDGKTICSVISEATIAAKLGVDVQEGFRPSVPFVATASAAMVIAETVKALVFRVPAKSMLQIANLFWGPEETTITVSRPPSASCQCVVHRKTILQLRAKKAKERVICSTP